MIKSPLNYIGGKTRLLPQILPLLPDNIDSFVDLFAGGCNVGINTHAKNIIFNDSQSYLIDLYSVLRVNTIEDTIKHIENRIDQFKLSKTNKDGYLLLRELYNTKREPIDLFVLMAYSFNNQLRFNNSGGFNNPFGKRCFNPEMRKNLVMFVNAIKNNNIIFTNHNFTEYDISTLGVNDFVYCDPPYLITDATYNKNWDITEENKLYDLLNTLNNKGVNFGLSNVLDHKGKSNNILKEWIHNNDYNINYMNISYANASYNTSGGDTVEVLVTNYK